MSNATTLLRNKDTGVADNGGRFAAHVRQEASIGLQVFPNDATNGLTAEQASEFVAVLADDIDLHVTIRDSATDDIADGTHSGRAHALAEILAYTLTDDGADAEAAGEELLNARALGTRVEDGTIDAIPAVRRQMIVDHCRTRAQDAFNAAEAETEIPDVAAWHFGRYEAFEDTALDLSNPHTDFGGIEIS